MDNIWVMALLLITCLCKCWKIKTPLWLTLKFNRVRRQRRLQSPCWKLTVRIRVRKKIVSFLASISTAITNLNYSRRKMKPFWPKSSPLNQGTWPLGVRKQVKATQPLNRPWKATLGFFFILFLPYAFWVMLGVFTIRTIRRQKLASNTAWNWHQILSPIFVFQNGPADVRARFLTQLQRTTSAKGPQRYIFVHTSWNCLPQKTRKGLGLGVF